MLKKILPKLFIALFPQSLILTGSLLLSFALKLVNIENLSEQEEGLVNGGVSMSGVGMNIPVQNDTLFWWGFILFILGSVLELIRIIYTTINSEMKMAKIEEVSEELRSETEEILSETKELKALNKKSKKA